MASVAPKKASTGSIASKSALCNALSISISELDRALSLPPSDSYDPREIAKKSGGIRIVYNPHRYLRLVQRRLNSRIFANKNVITWPSHIYGSIPNQPDDEDGYKARDYVACVARHCGAKSVLSLDIENFFDNIHEAQVADIIKRFLDYKGDVPEIIAKLCTHEGRVVQGALTSSYLANLALLDVEGEVVLRLSRKNLVYTRLVDDITVSSRVHGYNFDYARKLIEDMLLRKELPVNNSKTQVQYISTDAMTVHGIRASFKEPRLPRDEIRRIRAAVKRVETLASERDYRTTHAYRRDFNRCMGLVNKLSRVGHNKHGSYIKRLDQVKPLPSKRDIDRAWDALHRLKRDYRFKNQSYWYYRRFHQLWQRVNILDRTFYFAAEKLRDELMTIRPEYER